MIRMTFVCCLLLLFLFPQAQSTLPGATITILNTNYSTVADATGKFHLPALRPGTYTLVISATGYAITTRTIVIGRQSRDQPATENITIRLAPSDTQLDAVIVTAQKKQELLRQTPLSVTALSSHQVEAYRLWNSKDITAIAPNLYSADPGDGRNATGIRGIATTSYTPAVATYIDGVNQFSLDSYIFQLFDVERIEVLRGPQGTLYGRNAMGGVINIITKQPTNDFSGFAEASIGNYGRQRYSLGLRMPLLKDKLFLGAAGLYDGRNGYYHNTITNSSYEDQHSYTGNYYLKYLPSKSWDLTLNAKHVNNRNHGPFPLVADDPFKDPFVLSQNAVTTMIDNTVNAGLSVNYKGPGVIFSSQTAWQQNYRYYTKPIDGDFSPLDAITIINNYGGAWNKTKTWTQEFKFNSPASGTSPWNWTAGVWLFRNDAPVKQATHYGNDATALGSPDSNFTTINTTKSTNKGIAFYGQATYSLTPALQLTGGLRYDYEHQTENVLGEYQPDGIAPIITTPDTSGKTSFHAWSPKGSLSYTVNKDNLVYGSYSRGFRTGGLTQLSSDPSQPPLYAYRPEYSNNFELGWKTDFLRKLIQLNLTAFYSTIRDAQVPTLLLPDAITVTRNAGKLTSKGIEAEIAATPVKGLQINYNFGYTHAIYKDLSLSQNGNVVDLSGRHQVFTPEVTSMLAAQYNYTIGPARAKGPAHSSTTSHGPVRLFLRGEWRYLGETWFDLANTIKQPAYSLFNASAGIVVSRFSITVWARNFTNKRYISYAYDFGAAHLGDPRTYGATVGIKF